MAHIKKTKNLKNPMAVIAVIFALCFVLRLVEYLFIRTDQSFFGEAFIHKLLGVAVLAFFLNVFNYSWQDIGFLKDSKHIVGGLLLGFAVGIGSFVLGYGSEYFANAAKHTKIDFLWYVESFAQDGDGVKQTAIGFFLLCIVFNLLNVVMEEGLFRGLFAKIAEQKYAFLLSNLIVSAFFGLWHIAMPLRSLIDGKIKFWAFLGGALGYAFVSLLVGFKFGLLHKITGGLWAPMADHFVNNTIVNLLHVATESGADEYQFLRITIAQTISFIVVLVLYYRSAIKKLIKANKI